MNQRHRRLLKDKLSALAASRRYRPSLAQERLLFLEQVFPGTATYNVPLGFVISGQFDADAFQRAVNEVVVRHDALRTSFPVGDDGHFTAEVKPHAVVDVQVHDLSDLPLENREEQAIGRAEADAGKAFDLSEAPLCRVSIYVMGAAKWVLLINCHHLVVDGWSVGVLMRELSALYREELSGIGADLQQPAWQYTQFSSWQRKWVAGKYCHDLVEQWREMLSGARPILELPTDRPRPAVVTNRGNRRMLVIPEAVCERLEKLARDRNLTPFIVYMAGFLTVVYRYTQQEDLVIGCPVANRRRQELEQMIGMFSSTVVLRTLVDDQTTLEDLLSRVRDGLIWAYDHQDIPVEQLIDELGLERDLSRNPLFQVTFSYQRGEGSSLVIDNARVVPVDVDTKTSKFDMSVTMEQRLEGTVGVFVYNSDLFSEDMMVRFTDCYLRVLDLLAREPDCLVGDIDLLTDDDLDELRSFSHSAQRDEVRRSMVEMLTEQMEKWPDKTAIVTDDQVISYGEFNLRVCRLARLLRERGVDRGTIVGVFMDRCPEQVIAIHAVVLAGGAYLPLEPDFPQSRLNAMIEDARPCLLIVDGGKLDQARDLMANAVSMDNLEADAGAAYPELPSDNITPDDVLYVMYTSGSTGRPKGVMVPHVGPASRMSWIKGLCQLQPGDRVLYKTAVGFDVSVTELFWPFLVGATLVVTRPGGHVDPGYLVDMIARHNVVFVQFVPSMLRLFLDCPDVERCANLKYVLALGEALPADVINRFNDRLSDVAFYNVYGPTEASIVATCWECPDSWPGGYVPIGRPISNTRVWILDRNLRPVPVGVDGELCIGGDCLARGYLHLPDLTGDRFVPDPFSAQDGDRLYRTGDICRYLPDGTILFLGRCDDQVQVRGLRVELGEIETALCFHPQVKAAAAKFFAEETTGGMLVAYIESADPPAPAELSDHLRQHVPDAMIPSAYVTVDSLPVSAAGKVNRKALPRPDREMLVTAAYVEPETEMERVLTTIWAELLHRDQVGTADDFFELGGHSLLAIRVIARIRQEIDVDLTIRDLLTTRTIAGLADIVEQRPGPGMVDLQLTEGQGVSSFQEQLWLSDNLIPGLSSYNLPEVLTIRGQLDENALERALGRIWNRHEALRSTFPDVDDRPTLSILPPGSFRLERINVRDHAHAEDEAVQQAGQFIRQPFDLARGPLFRGALFQVSDQEWLLALCCHHIVADGQSLAVVLRELETAYEDVVTEGNDRLAPLPWQYHQYAWRQRESLRSPAMETKLQQARDRLLGTPGRLAIPTDRVHSGSLGGGDTREVSLSRHTVDKLTATVRADGVTPFMALLTLFFVLLHRYTDQEDLIVGTPFSVRDTAGSEAVIGYFVNPLPIRVSVDDRVGFIELASRVKDAAAQAFETGAVPFDRLVNALNLQRTAGHNPLFQVMFAVAQPPDLPELNGVEMSRIHLHTQTSKFMLNMAVIIGSDDYKLGLEYDTALFEQQTIDTMLGHYRNLLQAVVSDPTAPVAAVPITDDSEVEQLVRLGTGPDVPVDRRSLCDLIDDWAERTPSAPAVVADQALTYKELHDQSNQLAGYLQSLGVRPGTIVGLGIPRCAQMIVGIMAVHKCGAAYLPLDPAYPADRLQFMITDAGVSLLLSTRRAAAAFAESGSEVVCVDCEQKRINAFPPCIPEMRVDPTAPAYVIYTSGTTGRPKGALCHHLGIVNLVAEVERLCHLPPGHRHSLWTSLNFDASVYEIYTALLGGGCLYIVPDEIRADGPAVINWLQHQQIASGYLPPFLVPDLVRSAGSDLALCRLMVGVEPLSERELADISTRVPGLQILNAYGPTEASVISTFYLISGDHGPHRPAPIGRPIQNGQLLVLDRHGQLTPRFVPGELYIGGIGVADGYLARPDLTAERFVCDPLGREEQGRFYRSGDLVRWLPDGNLQFIGRTDRQIKLRGFRIEPGEIEAQLVAYPGVHDAVVILARTGAVRLVAYVVLEQGVRVSAAQIRSFLAHRLPDYMVPATVMFLTALPVTPNGKFDFRALPEPDDRQQPDQEDVPHGLAAQLSSVFCRVLNLDHVGLNANFFELGGDSLATLRIVNLAREQGIALQPRQLFEYQTIAELVTALETSPVCDKTGDDVS